MKTELNLIKLLFIYEVKIWLEHLISKGRKPTNIPSMSLGTTCSCMASICARGNIVNDISALS